MPYFVIQGKNQEKFFLTPDDSKMKKWCEKGKKPKNINWPIGSGNIRRGLICGGKTLEQAYKCYDYSSSVINNKIIVLYHSFNRR